MVVSLQDLNGPSKRGSTWSAPGPRGCRVGRVGHAPHLRWAVFRTV